MNIKIIDMPERPLETIYKAFKICVSADVPTEIKIPVLETSIGDIPDRGAMNDLIKRHINHESCLEHCNFTFAIENVSRSLLAQLSRHRIASYSVQSQRYVNAKSFSYVVPEAMEDNSEMLEEFEDHIKDTVKRYEKLIDMGLDKEDARAILPNACTTNIIMTMNLREFRHFYSERSCCFDDKTEILTQNGWKLFKDLNKDDVYYSLNPNTMECEYAKAKDIIQLNYDGDLISVKSQSIDLLETPNHNNFVSYSYDYKKFQLDRADNNINHKMVLMKKNCKPISGKITEEFIIPGVKVERRNQFNDWVRTVEERKVNIHDFMKFLGFYLSDGWLNKAGDHYNIGVCKGDEAKIDKYYDILNRLTPNTVKKYKTNAVWRLQVHDINLFELLSQTQHATTKYIPEYAWQYDSSILNSLFEGLCDGDFAKKSCAGGTYYSSSKRLIDDLQRLLLHLGYSGTIGVDDRIGQVSSGIDSAGKPFEIVTKNLAYRITVNKTKNEPIIKTTNRDAFSSEYYKGKVYCVELEKNHIIHVRRNGKTVWSGNCHAQTEIRTLANKMMELVQEHVSWADYKAKKCGTTCFECSKL